MVMSVPVPGDKNLFLIMTDVKEANESAFLCAELSPYCFELLLQLFLAGSELFYVEQEVNLLVALVQGEAEIPAIVKLRGLRPLAIIF